VFESVNKPISINPKVDPNRAMVNVIASIKVSVVQLSVFVGSIIDTTGVFTLI